MTKPSIGRIVHFHRLGAVCAAIITAVHSDECVNLCVFLPNGQTTPETSVILAEASVPSDAHEGHATWPVRS